MSVCIQERKKKKNLDYSVQEGQLGSWKQETCPSLPWHKAGQLVVCVLQGHSLQLQNKPCQRDLLASLCAKQCSIPEASCS